MKQIALIILIYFNVSFIFSQEIKAETIYQKCVYNSLSDKGTLLKKYTKEFENVLIKSNVLKDSTSKAYFELFKALGTNKWKNFNYNYSYIDSINKTASYKTILGNSDCKEVMRNFKDFKKSKFFKMRTISVKECKTMEELLKKMSFFLEEEDFELDFYKYRTLLFLEDLIDFNAIENSLIDTNKVIYKTNQHSNYLLLVKNQPYNITIRLRENVKLESNPTISFIGNCLGDTTLSTIDKAKTTFVLEYIINETGNVLSCSLTNYGERVTLTNSQIECILNQAMNSSFSLSGVPEDINQFYLTVKKRYKFN